MHPVRTARKEKWMTQAYLAKRAGVSLRTIHAVEQGKDVRPDTKRKILRALGMEFGQRHRLFPIEPEPTLVTRNPEVVSVRKAPHTREMR